MLLLETIGYNCCDNNDGKCATFYIGGPNSGKSLLTGFQISLFDQSLIATVPLHNLSDKFNRALLYGKKLNAVGEIKGKPLSDITFFKELTGSDYVIGEFKGKTPFTFKAKCKLLYSGNVLPFTSESDPTSAFANRLNVLSFNASIPLEEQDKNLQDKLDSERDAIFTLAIRALQELHHRNYIFTKPQDSIELFATLSAAQMPPEDGVAAFIRECCEIGPTYKIANTNLFNAYANYCNDQHINGLSRNKFYEIFLRITDLPQKKIRIGSQSLQGRVGIKLCNKADMN
jgi:putative DNA primase/helicase